MFFAKKVVVNGSKKPKNTPSDGMNLPGTPLLRCKIS